MDAIGSRQVGATPLMIMDIAPGDHELLAGAEKDPHADGAVLLHIRDDDVAAIEHRDGVLADRPGIGIGIGAADAEIMQIERTSGGGVALQPDAAGVIGDQDGGLAHSGARDLQGCGRGIG